MNGGLYDQLIPSAEKRGSGYMTAIVADVTFTVELVTTDDGDRLELHIFRDGTPIMKLNLTPEALNT